MGVGETPYNIVLVLHILAVICAFGYGMMSNPIMQNAAKNGPADALATLKAMYATSKGPAMFATYGIAIFGFGLVGLSDDVISFGDTWIALSILLYIALVGILHGVMLPNEKKLIAAMETGDVEMATEIRKKLQTFGPMLGVIGVVVTYLMVFKPGA